MEIYNGGMGLFYSYYEHMKLHTAKINAVICVYDIGIVEELALKAGDSVTALVKSTSVMIQK